MEKRYNGSMRNRVQDEPRGSNPVGLFFCPAKEDPLMSYRKVDALEQCWYIIRYWLREKFRRRR
jgi:hypothetical protein